MLVGRAMPTTMALLAVLASSAGAQTPDPVFAGWSFAPASVGSRPAGMGGAFVGLADDTKAAFVNPAGLTRIPLTEIGLSTGEQWAAAAAGLTRIRFSAYLTRDEQETPTLVSSVSEGGIAAGVRPLRRLSLGAGVAWSRLSLESSPVSQGAAVNGENTHVRFTVGALLDLLDTSRRTLPALRLGLSFQPGFDWSIPVAPPPGAAPTSVDIRRPSLLSVGLAWRHSDRWTVGLQGDLVRYREVEETLRANVGDAAEDWSLPNAVEPRLGIEFTAPLWCGCGVAKLRGGVYYRSPGVLRYEGEDPALARAYREHSWETVATMGASFLGEYFGHALRLDLDARNVFDGPDISFGLVFRF
jgi:hypothetical protein